MNNAKNETKTDHDLLNFIDNEKSYQFQWEMQKTTNTFIQGILNESSKKNTGKAGYPDLIYVNKDEKLLILVENKSVVRDHVSKNQDNPSGYAVDGIKHYLSFFTKSNIKKQKPSIQNFFKDWKYIGIAFSGDINSEYGHGHLLDTFKINDDTITDIDTKSILNEKDYLSFFENIDLEKIADDISQTSMEINRLLRSLDSQNRPILLSALMICLYPNAEGKDFINNYPTRSAKQIIRAIPDTVSDILKDEGVHPDKIEVLLDGLAFMNSDPDLNGTGILKAMLKTLHDDVIPLFDKGSSYDIIGKFYEEFLRYAGIANVKKGIVLTPNHVTTLFTELIDIKTNDVIFDPACGTGAFLIAGMNKIAEIIKKSNLPDKKKKLENIKTDQLVGFEKSSTMYSLAISNMLFRGDGKSKIYNEDFFLPEASDILSKLKNKPTIGFINPPFGGKDNEKNYPTKKEIQFLEKMLDNCSRYGIIIAPLSTYIKEEAIRKQILSKHTLKYVINMPNDLFQPNASTHTAIAVFKTNQPHENSKVVFYDLKDDGLVLSKHKGRTDVLNKWSDIKKVILNKISHPSEYNDMIKLVYKEINPSDEWIIQAHAKTDYSNLKIQSFEKSIKKCVIFSTKMKHGLINADLDELTLLEILDDSNITALPLLGKSKQKIMIDTSNWSEFYFCDVFTISRGDRLTRIDQIPGDIAYISSSKNNNGIDNYILPPDNMKIFEKCLTLSNSGSVGYCFYHPYKFVSSDHCTVIEIKNTAVIMNNYIGLFIKPVIELIRHKYSFGREINNNRLKNERIILPIDKTGQPDWQFMETYIKSLPYSANL